MEYYLKTGEYVLDDNGEYYGIPTNCHQTATLAKGLYQAKTNEAFVNIYKIFDITDGVYQLTEYGEDFIFVEVPAQYVKTSVNDEVILVSSNDAILQWLRENVHCHCNHLVLSNDITVSDVFGRRVYGTLPTCLASKCREYYEVSFTEDKQPSNMSELTRKELENNGIKLIKYRIEKC